MVVVIDIGNTNIHAGLYAGERLQRKIVYPTARVTKEKALRKIVQSGLPDAVAVSSVVPRVTRQIIRFFKEQFGLKPFVVSSRVATPLRFDYYKPETVGADRIANVVGGLARYKKNLIIIDFGTAITFDIVLRDGHYLGGMICPGMKTMAEALTRRTALLKMVSVTRPRHLVGKSTEECIQSGIFTGTVVMVQGLIQKIAKVYRKRFLCITTGGAGRLVAKHVHGIHAYDPHLTLFGVLKLYQYNASK